jgi:ribosomal protein S18 acetylase RimI-like enzyme
VPRIRPVQPGDEAALAEICLRTADAGRDGTGILDDDRIWAAMFVLPYAARHPDLAFVVETDDGRVAGYIVCAPDTDDFEQWFRTEWWPVAARDWPRPEQNSSRQDDLLLYGYERGDAPSRYQAAGYPAHLHIDLLPELQGAGFGRRLIETLIAALRERGVPGVHLVAGAENAGAVAFYPRVGFEPLPGSESARAFGMRL